MADREGLQHPGDFVLDGILIVGSSGLRLEIGNLLQELNIYQSLDSPYMSGSILLKDATGISEALPFLGQERLIFALRTPGRKKIDFNEYHAIIYNVGKRVHSSDRSQTVLLNFTTLENYKNIRTKISKSFKGEISTIVQEILSSENYLGSKKPLNIDITQNIRKFVIPNLRPFHAINVMKQEAISKEESSPHYLFYENPNGFHFRSLDSLLGKKQDLSIEEKHTYIFEPPAPGNVKVDPNVALNTLLHWEIHDNSNSFVNVKTGMFASTLYTHDIFNKNIQKFEFDYVNSYKGRNSTNQNKKSHGPLVALTKTGDKTITEYSESRIFVHPTGSENLHTEGKTDNNAKDWLQESRSREVEKQFFTLKINTYGNTNLMVGDIINVIIPANKPLGTAEGKDAIDRTLSGRYLITEQHHLVIPSSQMHSMTMTIMKDSFENAPPVVETKYKAEPMGSSDIGLRRRSLVA
jgi:hypothetical protein